MKRLIAALLLVCCLSVPALAKGKAVPNLVGTWRAEVFHLHHGKHGFISSQDKDAKLTVTDQKGRIFHGTVEWGGAAPGKDTVSGVIDKDNKSFYMIGHSDGVRIGKMEGPDAFTFYYLSPGQPNPRAGYVEYKRVK